MKSNFHMSNNYTITKLNFIYFQNDLSPLLNFIEFFNSKITLNFVMHLIKKLVVILISLFFFWKKNYSFAQFRKMFCHKFNDFFGKIKSPRFLNNFKKIKSDKSIGFLYMAQVCSQKYITTF